MGRPMAKNLLAAGHEVTVYNRTASRCDEAVEADRPALRWISRSADPNDPSIEWLVLYGPGAEKTPSHEPLGRLAPFAGDRAISI